VSTEPVPDDLRRFVLTSVPSVPYLEALLLLRSQPRERWEVRSVARRLYVPEHKADELLRELEAAGLARREAEVWQYAPRDPALAAMVDRLADLYASRLVEVTTLIHSRVDRRAMQFADAFRFKKEP
jgi:Mn-dependent DtxR family transcriptional regulator